MDAETTERELRKQLETSIGRGVSDLEWEAFKRAAVERANRPSARAGRALAAGTGGIVGFLAASVVAGVVWYGLIGGLVWAYDPENLWDEDDTVWGLVLGTFLIGAVVVGAYRLFPRLASIVLGLGFLVGVGALIVGALLRAVG